uniref:S1 motif domain-containing protein n=1 Tax=Timema bartmani TaxID=61472 RepID=A0A7R9FDV6_9NEOP|nr:unnamed protein product [Timema bartmani]
MKGSVKSVHPYGAFVQMPGAVVQGLVHRTQVSSVSVSDVSEVLQPGERVWCKVINITVQYASTCFLTYYFWG